MTGRGLALSLVCALGCGGVAPPEIAPPFPDAGPAPSLAVAVLSPAPGAVLPGGPDAGTYAIEAAAQAVGLSGSPRLQLTIDGDPVGSSQTGNLASWVIALSELRTGGHSLAIAASLGGLGATASVDFSVADGGP